MVWVYPEIYAGSEIYQLFEAAIQFVTDDERLGPSWFSTDVSDFVLAAGPLPKMKLWKKFEVLHVYLPSKDFILAHKLIAAREKDIPDIQALCAQLGIDTRKKAQKVLDKYISLEIQENNHATDKLDIFFR